MHSLFLSIHKKDLTKNPLVNYEVCNMKALDIELEIVNITSFIYDTVREAGFSKVIVGLSGGVDSALVAGLCTLSLGKDNVIGVMMPYKNSHPDSLAHAELLVKFLHITAYCVPITEMVDSYFEWFESDADVFRRGNRMARERMCILYDLSAKYKALVVGTSNKSEIFTGYCTQYGDSACAFEPIAHLYKTEVFEIAKTIKIPDEIIQKPPTADLWEGQTDEGELGISYQELDKILYSILDVASYVPTDCGDRDIAATEKFNLVMKKVQNSLFKRRLPLTMENVWEL